ncbi:hypothetical protein BIV57_00555 [Mangrovactinospora gilvigrisea]|uniref:Uncharacterized protein n=1 Tax=Mangrovactinospora gilvigrisea TaxID=1428644 RepID=A0A1J7CIB1_9ACTN|nr:hypothetical protein BIV57_00555 [Mangrovactinospora gilvigrisea]
MRKLGFDAVLTFGHALNEGFSAGRGDVHAWVTLRSDSTPVDTLASYDYLYFVIGRYPEDAPSSAKDS